MTMVLTLTNRIDAVASKLANNRHYFSSACLDYHINLLSCLGDIIQTASMGGGASDNALTLKVCDRFIRRKEKDFELVCRKIRRHMAQRWRRGVSGSTTFNIPGSSLWWDMLSKDMSKLRARLLFWRRYRYRPRLFNTALEKFDHFDNTPTTLIWMAAVISDPVHLQLVHDPTSVYPTSGRRWFLPFIDECQSIRPRVGGNQSLQNKQGGNERPMILQFLEEPEYIHRARNYERRIPADG